MDPRPRRQCRCRSKRSEDKNDLRNPQKLAFFLTVAVLVIVLITLPVYFFYNSKEITGAVVTNGLECSAIGTSILTKGGSAIDAAIAALFCEGIAMPQSMGLGGGFLMTVYQRSGTVKTLNAREVAPLAAYKDMFHGNQTLSTKGGLAAAVPGELRGYQEAYKFGGKLPWRDLVQPTIDLCKSGIKVTEYLANLYKTDSVHATLISDEGLRADFINPQTGRAYTINERIKRPKLAKTLEIIAGEPDALHDGSLTQGFVDDMRNLGGIITKEDMNGYRPIWDEAIRVNLPLGQTLYTFPLPGSGVILAFILNIVKDILEFSEAFSITNEQRIVESFKFGYGKRSELGDLNTPDMKALLRNLTSESFAEDLRVKIHDDSTSQDFTYYGGVAIQPEDHGTAHISVLAPNGDAVSVTSTVNLYFGAGVTSQSTGIVLNNEMDDFSSPGMPNYFGLPPSPNNYIEGGKHPLSSMCPSIVVDKNGDVKLVVGGAGGTKITTSVAWVIMRNLWFGLGLPKAISERRFHHQLYPMKLSVEDDKTKEAVEFVNKMRKIGHDVELVSSSGFSAITAISNESNVIVPSPDTRRPGSVSFVYN